MTRCSATRANGDQCRAQALPGHELCWAHDPSHRAKAAEARKAGGKNSSRAARIEARTATGVKDISRILESAMGRVYSGTMKPAQGAALASMAGAWIKLREVGEVDERLAELERRLEAGWQRRQG